MGSPPSHPPDASAPSSDPSPPAGVSPFPDPLTPDILLRFVQDAVIGTDLTFHITSWNPGAEALYGWPAAEVLGQTVQSVLHTQYLDGAEDQALAQLRTAGTWRGDVRQQHYDGHALTIMASVALVRSPTGEPLGVVSVNRDISARTMAEAITKGRLVQEAHAARQVAAEALARLDTLITSLPTGIGYLDHTLRYQLVNPALAALNGHTPAAHVGRTMIEIVPHLAPQLEPPARQVLSTGVAVRDLELHGQAQPDDATRTWLISFFPIHNAAGAVTGVGVTVTDTTAITQTTAALRETERKLTTLFELLPVGVSIFDNTGTIVSMNPAQEAILRRQQAGLSHEGVLARPFLRPDGTPRLREELATERALCERQPVLNVESGFVSGTGAMHWLNVSAVPVEFPDWRVVAVATDITARVEAERALEQDRQQLAAILHTMHEGVIAIRPDRTLALSNPAALRLRNLDPAAPPLTLMDLARTPHQYLDARGHPVVQEALPLPRVLRGEHFVGLELRLRSTIAETEHWLSFNGTPVYDPDGTLILGVVTSQDITQRKRDEAQLHQQAAMLDHAHIVVRDAESRIVFWNQGAERLYGWTAAEAVGRVSHALFQTHFPTSLEAVQAQLFATGRWEGELIHYRRDGHAVVVASLQLLFRDATGAPTHILEVNNDVTALKRAEEALRERDAQLRLAHDAAQLGTWWRDPAAALLHFDSRAQTLFGIAAEVAPVEVLLTRIHPDDRAIWRQAVAATTDPAGDGRATVEYRVVHPDGRVHWLAIHARASFTDGGHERRPVMTSGTVQDITARKQEEAALRVSEANLQAIFASTAQAHLLLDTDLRLVQWNTLAEVGVAERFGRALRVGAPIGDYMLPESLPERLALMHRALAGERIHTELDVSTSVQSHWLEVDYAPVHEAHGQIRGICVSTLDVTARHMAEVQLRASEARFRLLAEQAQDLIFRYRLAPEPGFEYVSPSATAITGYTPEEHYADPQLGFSLVEPEDRHLLDQTTTGQLAGPLTLRWRRKDGTVIWTEQLNRLIVDAVGQPVAIEGIARDITARKQAEEQLRAALVAEQRARVEVQAAQARLQQLSQRLLEAQEQERRHIARELHDEVGQILGALKINLHMLRVQSDDAQMHSRLAESLAMLDALIQVVRALSLELRPAVLDDLGLSAALAWYCDRLAQRSSITVVFEDRLQGVPVPAGVATTCFRIAQEALTNVVRHAQARRVTVTLSRQEALLVLGIGDDGVGFDVVDRRSQAAVGASLGLISMRERAELVGGWVDISSSPHDGTEVWAWLPLV